jgi:hypothetical protein
LKEKTPTRDAVRETSEDKRGSTEEIKKREYGENIGRIEMTRGKERQK